MINAAQPFVKIFTDNSRYVNSSAYRFYLLSNYLYGLFFIIHISFIVLFTSLNIKELAIFNIVSAFLYIFIFMINYRGKLITAFLLTAGEVVVHASLGSYFLGDAGLRHALIFLIMLLFTFPVKRHIYHIIPGTIIAILYAILNYFEHNSTPVANMPQHFYIYLNLAISVLVAFIAAFIAFYYQSGAEKSDIALNNEYKRYEDLLLNTLPQPIVDQLLDEKNKIIAERFENTTILFADIVDFTSFSESISSEELVDILNKVFSLFDSLTEKYGLEKIKTIGDAYMVAGGIPIRREDHATAIAHMAIDMIGALKRFNKEYGYDLNLRIGVNSGSAVAGVIGTKKFIYDVWGDTVNIASRMESHGVNGKIQVSENTKNMLGNEFTFENRGQIIVKGKGALTAYILTGKKWLLSYELLLPNGS